MSKLVSLLLLFAFLPSPAAPPQLAPGTSRVFDRLLSATAEPGLPRLGRYGLVRISWPSFTDLAGDYVPAGERRIDVGRSGLLDVELLVYDGYLVTYQLEGEPAYSEWWDVPASSAPLALPFVVTNGPPPPDVTGPRGLTGPTGPAGGGHVVDLFDSATTSLADGSSVSWSSCSTNARCASWTVPAGVTWVRVQAWGAGASGGGGAGAGGGGSGGMGGSGGGFGEGICPLSPGTALTVQVGLGGVAASGYGTGSAGGATLFGSCLGATGALSLTNWQSGSPGVQSFGGVANPPEPMAMPASFYASPLAAIWNSALACAGLSGCGWNVAGVGPSSLLRDTGAYGAVGSAGSGGSFAGQAGGSAIGGGGGGGSGASQSATVGVGGLSLFGGSGGAGAASAAACVAGSSPGGGGGGGYLATSGNTSGCAGARGEVRVYF